MQTLTFGAHYILAAAAHVLPGAGEREVARVFVVFVELCRSFISGTLVLALAGDDMRVHLYTQADATADTPQFVSRMHLPGHEDWISGLDFVAVDDCMRGKKMKN